jgi:hypothetical protein
MMQTVFQTALDAIAKWPDDKFDAMLGYMERNMDKRDVEYIKAKRRIMREHGETFPRQAAFTLIQR